MMEQSAHEETWAQLVAAALLGTERKPFTVTPGAGATGEMLALISPPSGEKALLDAAALVSLYREAGQVPATSAAPLPEPSPPETLPYCSHHAMSLLAQASGSRQELRQLWLTEAAKAGQIVPPTYLVELLNSLSGLDLTTVQAVIGERGRWLARHREQWNLAGSEYLDPAQWDEVWETGNSNERGHLIDTVRFADPARARELIAKTWKSDKADDRSRFISVMRIKLTMDDEPFLEAALDDRAGDVRAHAAAFLTFLPQSRLVQRMTERADAMLDLKQGKASGLSGMLGGKKLELEVNPPKEADKALQRDGVAAKSPTRGTGDRAWWLQEVLTAVPPSHWTARFGRTPAEIVAAIEGNQWQHNLLRGLIRATLRSKDRDWVEALLKVAPWDRTVMSSELPFLELVTLLPQERREAWVMEYIQRSDWVTDMDNSIITGLGSTEWSPQFSRAVLNVLKRELPKMNPDRTYRLRNVLYYMAMLVPISTLPDAENGWPTTMEKWDAWAGNVNEFISVVRLRAEIAEEFSR